VKKQRFSVEQITSVLQQVARGVPVGDVCRQVGISEQTFYRWKKTYDGMLPSEARELKQLREENTKLKRRDGPVGVHEWCHPRLQPSWQADGQRRYRIVQRTVPGRMSKRALVCARGRREAEDRRVSLGLQ